MKAYYYIPLTVFTASLALTVYQTWYILQWIFLMLVILAIAVSISMLIQFQLTWHKGHIIARQHMDQDIEERDFRTMMVAQDEGVRIKKWEANSIEFHKPPAKVFAHPGEEQLALPLPHKNVPKMVRLEDYMRPGTSRLSKVFLGLTTDSEPVYADFREMFHIIIAGTTRWGKSEFIRSLLIQWLWSAEEEMEFYLIDTGGTTFKDFGLPFVEDPGQALALISDLRVELVRRSEIFKKDRHVKSLDTYNAIYPDEKLSRLVIVIEEGLDLILQREVIKPELVGLVSWAAKYGLHVVFISQSVKTNIISNEMRSNFSSRFQFHAEDRHQARTLIAESQAHQIKDRGRFECMVNGQFFPQIQSPMVDVETAIIAGDSYNAKCGNCFDPETYVWDLSEMSREHSMEDEEIGRQFMEILDGPGKFSWRKATKAIYGEGKFGESYNTKLRKVLDSLSIEYPKASE